MTLGCAAKYFHCNQWINLIQIHCRPFVFLWDVQPKSFSSIYICFNPLWMETSILLSDLMWLLLAMMIYKDVFHIGIYNFSGSLLNHSVKSQIVFYCIAFCGLSMLPLALFSPSKSLIVFSCPGRFILNPYQKTGHFYRSKYIPTDQALPHISFKESKLACDSCSFTLNHIISEHVKCATGHSPQAQW